MVLLLKLKAQQLKCFGKYSFLLVTSCLLGHPHTYNRQLVTPFHSSTSFSKIPVVVELTFVIVLDKFMLSFILEPIEFSVIYLKVALMVEVVETYGSDLGRMHWS